MSAAIQCDVWLIKIALGSVECVPLYAVQCHLLNVDVVTQFDPHLHDMLKKSVEDCERCIANVTATDTEAQDLVNSQ